MNVSIPRTLFNKINAMSGIDHNLSTLGLIRISIQLKNTITSNTKDVRLMAF